MRTDQVPLHSIPCLRRLFKAEIILAVWGIIGQILMFFKELSAGSFTPVDIIWLLLNLFASGFLLYAGVRGKGFIQQSVHPSKEFRVLANFNIVYTVTSCLRLVYAIVLLALLAAEAHGPLKTLLGVDAKDPLLKDPAVWESVVFWLNVVLWVGVVELVVEIAIGTRAAVICRQNAHRLELATEQPLIEQQKV